jgi:hypothetical protein
MYKRIKTISGYYPEIIMILPRKRKGDKLHSHFDTPKYPKGGRMITRNEKNK